ncbi:Oxidoreductase family, NAD-binding Rossmann fold [Posidoniimonas corsicana]|uniref:Oxidoreductase family, NAD-binding Rossmann fold n=1 Tax=Posidoniimonas corsicana TaxID=1938618 RepID=A0A5C5VH86_9BACT|nr:DUF1559 domain-containing protein [Posidoniimonas corsicana]TWT37353.1 Oxidoreductase family, NAD-binding Rossmann fold [Posidoniimonas corsicana]
MVELLVVVAIIGMPVAMLPAAHAARESARRTQCANNLKQSGCGILNLENTFGAFPSGDIAPLPEIDDYRSVLDRQDIDVVSIVTPDHWHVRIAVDVFEAGKHVFCGRTSAERSGRAGPRYPMPCATYIP